MKYYHGSDNPCLEGLTTDHYENKLYVTDSYEMALMYAGCSLRSWGFDKENDLLIIIEMGEKAFEKMYKGKKCYIYNCDIDDAIKDEGNPSNHTYTVKHNVKLNNDVEVIEDVYVKFLELERQGKIKLIRWDTLSKEEQEVRKKRTIERWLPYMENERNNFSKEYELLIDIIPELKIKKL